MSFRLGWPPFDHPPEQKDEPTERFDPFSDEELRVIYEGLLSHGGDSADEAIMEDIEDECSRRGIRPLRDWL